MIKCLPPDGRFGEQSDSDQGACMVQYRLAHGVYAHAHCVNDTAALAQQLQLPPREKESTSHAWPPLARVHPSKSLPILDSSLENGHLSIIIVLGWIFWCMSRLANQPLTT